MKIAFIGPQGTGKTTLVYEFTTFLKKRNYNADVLCEVARKCPLPINEAATLESQRWIFFRQICEEIELSNKNDIVICDRSVLDSYAYLFNKFDHDDLTYPIVLEWIKTYDLLFKVPINNDFLKKDGLRSVNKKFQKEIDLALDTLIKEIEIKVYPYKTIEDVFDKFSKLKK